MKRNTLLSGLFALTAAPIVAMASATTPATYILQVASNLDCDNLSIEVVSTGHQSSQRIDFQQKSFGAVELAPGTYELGTVTCTTQVGEDAYNVLEDNIQPFTVDEGTAYFGGTIIFEEAVEENIGSVAKVFSDCPRVQSNARGQSSDGCFGGSGNNLTRNPAKQLKVYAPEVSEELFQSLNTAYSRAAKSQLVLLPLGV